MHALPSRIAVIAVTALLGAALSPNGAHAQNRQANGITFSPSGSWNISGGGRNGTSFKPVVTYSSWTVSAFAFGVESIFCCSPAHGNPCYFKNEDNGDYHTATLTALGTITSDAAFSGLLDNADG
jgi:hypothetical protein